MKEGRVEFTQIITESGMDVLEKNLPSVFSRTKFYALRTLIKILSKNLGLEVTYRLPQSMKKYGPEVWEIVPVFKKLRQLGIVDAMTFEVNDFPDEPQGFVTFVTIQVKSKKPRLGFCGVGRDMFSREVTLWPAIGEALERWALDTYEPPQQEILSSSYEEMRGPKIDIFKFAGFTPEQRMGEHSRFKLIYSKDTIFLWVKGYSLTQSEPVWLPLQLVSFKYSRRIQGNHEPLLSPSMSTGAATGQSLQSAITAGLLENIERDAFMIYWLNGMKPDLIDLKTILDPRFIELLEIAERFKLEVYLQNLKTDMPVYTVGVMLIDRTGIGPALTVSAITSFDLNDAVYKVLSSALAMRQSQRSLSLRKRDSRILNPAKLNHEERILYYSKIENLPKALFFTEGIRRSFEYILKESQQNVKTLDELINFFKKKEYQIVYKEILPSSFRKVLGPLTTVVVRVPELQPLHLDESLPAKGGSRLKEIPEFLGKIPAGNLNQDPHPFP